MKKISFVIEKKEYFFPDYLSLGQYQQIHSKKDTFDTDLNFLFELVHILTDAPKEQLRLLKKDDFLPLGNIALRYVKKVDETFHKTFDYEGETYGFIPELTNMSMAEYIDIDYLINDGVNKHLHLIMAILYRKVKYHKTMYGKTYYDIDDYDGNMLEQRANHFKGLDMNYVNGALVFFYNLGAAYLETLISSLEDKEMDPKMKTKLKEMKDRMKVLTSNKVGVGLEYYMEP